MNELYVNSAMLLYTDPVGDTSSADVLMPVTAPMEFVGSSDDTIAEAVRRALSNASNLLRTLEGVGVVVMPQIERNGGSPRFQVRLRISQAGTGDTEPGCA